MELRQLRQFLAVAEEGSFTAAADRLHMAQSPLSQAIRALERDLGTELIDRSRRRIGLTPAGAVLRDEAAAVLRRVEQARTTVGRSAPTRRIVVAALIDLPPRWFERAAAELASSGTDVQLELTEGSSLRNPRSVLQGRAGIGLTREPEVPAGLVRVPVAEEELGAIIPARHPMATRPEPIEPDELGSFGQWLGFPRSSAPGWFDHVAEFASACGLAPDLDSATEVRDLKIDRIVLGGGVNFAPRWQADRLGPTGAIWKAILGDPLVRWTSAVHCPQPVGAPESVAIDRVLTAMTDAWPATRWVPARARPPVRSHRDNSQLEYRQGGRSRVSPLRAASTTSRMASVTSCG